MLREHNIIEESASARNVWMTTISVKDTGIGLTEQQSWIINNLKSDTVLDLRQPVPVSSAIQPAPTSTSGCSGSWGLGLQIINNIISEMGGRMEAYRFRCSYNIPNLGLDI